tara:strand:- start:583 stop:744 length:162 start_codon:yes stop_codon:yes gene_type:complete
MTAFAISLGSTILSSIYEQLSEENYVRNNLKHLPKWSKIPLVKQEFEVEERLG